MAVPDDIIRKREKQRAIEKWENEGGRCVHADFIEAHKRERNDQRDSHEGATEKMCGIEA